MLSHQKRIQRIQNVKLTRASHRNGVEMREQLIIHESIRLHSISWRMSILSVNKRDVLIHNCLLFCAAKFQQMCANKQKIKKKASEFRQISEIIRRALQTTGL